MELGLAIEALLNEVDGGFSPSLSSRINIADYAKKLASNAVIFSTYDKGQLVAFIAIYCNDLVNMKAYMPMIVVADGYRDQGIASGLIRMSIHFLKKKGFRSFGLEVYKSNDKAFELYKKLGFIKTGETEHSNFLALDLIN